MIKYAMLIYTFCSILAFCSSSSSWAENLPDVIGKAYAFDDNQVLYEEHHFYSDDRTTHQVFYLSSDGNQFAHKVVNYQSGKSTPMFRQEDTRISQVVEVKWAGQQLLISYFAEQDGPKREKLIDVETPLVIDAGFDQFIRDNWNVLLKGDRLKFHFPAPSRMTLVSLAVENKQCSYSTDVDSCFFINASNWLFKMLVDPIELGYDKSSQQLKRFRGVANIHDEDGEGLKVDIHYHYPKQCEPKGLVGCDDDNEYSKVVEKDMAALEPLVFSDHETLTQLQEAPARYVW